MSSTELMLLAQVPVTGEGCPGASASGAAAASGCDAAGLACGTLVEGCGGLSVSSPRMPSICGATEEGTSGAAALS